MNIPISTTTTSIGTGYPFPSTSSSSAAFEPYPAYIYSNNSLSSLESCCLSIINKEISKIPDIDIGNIQKLLNGTTEDIKIAIEILSQKTKYAFRIIHELKFGQGIYGCQIFVDEYFRNNLYNLNLTDEIK